MLYEVRHPIQNQFPGRTAFFHGSSLILSTELTLRKILRAPIQSTDRIQHIVLECMFR
jgi:hypothetical protein